jgi:hypothetical protein
VLQRFFAATSAEAFCGGREAVRCAIDAVAALEPPNCALSLQGAVAVACFDVGVGVRVFERLLSERRASRARTAATSKLDGAELGDGRGG